MRWFRKIVRVGILVAPVVVFALSTALSSSVLAAQFTINLPQLDQNYTYGQPSADVPFNLGTSLAALYSVQLELDGTDAVGTVGFFEIPPSYESYPGSWAAIMNASAPISLQWWQGYTGSSSGPFTTTLTFFGGGNTPNWSFLQGGVADIEFGVTAALPANMYWVTYPSIDVTSATLVISATPTPEPSTIGLLAMGIVVAIGYRSWRRRPA